MGKKNFYAVAKGRQIGVYETWAECKAQVDGFKGAMYAGFETVDEAQDFLDEHCDLQMYLCSDSDSEDQQTYLCSDYDADDEQSQVFKAFF